MPLVQCTKDGKSGWKWGHKNTSCFTGPNGKKNAIKQAIVIEGGPEKFKKKMDAAGEDYSDALSELLYDKTISNDELFILMHTLRLNLIEQASVLSQREKNV